MAQPVRPAHKRLPGADVLWRERVAPGYTMDNGTEFSGTPDEKGVTIKDTYYGW